GHQDDAFVRFEAVHLNQQLVQRLFALIVSAAQTSAAVASNSVDFVDEDDARSILLALLKQITHAACAHSDEHFVEVRAGNEEPQRTQQDQWRPGSQQLQRQVSAVDVAKGHDNALFLQLLDHVRIVRRSRRVESRIVGQLALDLHPIESNIVDATLINIGHEL